MLTFKVLIKETPSNNVLLESVIYSKSEEKVVEYIENNLYKGIDKTIEVKEIK